MSQPPAENPGHGSAPQSAPQEEARAVDSRGAVDLSGLAEAGNGSQQGTQGAAPSASGAETDTWVVSISPQQLQQVVQLSAQAPVIVLIHGSDQASDTMRTSLRDAVDAQQGRLLLAEADAEASPELAQSLGGAQVPAAIAFISGQPAAQLDSSIPTHQLGEVVSQLVQLATQNGMTQSLPPQGKRTVADQPEPELPPLHQKAHEALEANDLEGAAEAFEQALKEKPDDEDARIGLARVRLMQRTADVDLNAARTRAAENPDDVEAQIAVADLDVLGGHVDDAFARLVRYIQSHFDDDRERARAHLVELYSIVGDTDPRVNKSRQKLARALF